MSNDFTLLYCSCDKYECLWAGFFKLLKKYWPRFDARVILNTEEKSFEYPGFSITRPSKAMIGCTWSQRMLHCINEIETPYVLLVLDDFYLKSPVDSAAFQDSLCMMNNHGEIGLITFASEPGPNYPVSWDNRFERRGRIARYRINAQIGLWRKDYLLRILRSSETPWQFELNGSFRSSWMSSSILSLKKESSLIFDYDWGFLMIRGSINPQLKDYFQRKEGISVTYDAAQNDSNQQHRLPLRFFRMIKYSWDMVMSVFSQ